MNKLPLEIKVDNFEKAGTFLTEISKLTRQLGNLYIFRYLGTGIEQIIFTQILPRVIIICDDVNGALPVFWFEGFTAGNSKQFDGVVINDGILGLSPTRDGFRIGTNPIVNSPGGVTYKFMVLGQ